MDSKKDLMPIISLASSIFILGILGIAVSSIATECYDKNPTFKTEKKDNYGYVIAMIVINIIVLFLASSSVAMAMK